MNLYRRIVIILAIVALSIVLIVPPERKLNRAKDLAGGSTLVYQVELRPGDPPDLMERVRQLIKQRVDPQGVLDVSVSVVGSNRLEVSMPLASGQSRALRQEYEASLEELTQSALTAERLERALRLGGAERAGELERLARGSAERQAELQSGAVAFDAARAAAEEFAAARPRFEEAIAAAGRGVDEARAAGLPQDVVALLEENKRAAERGLEDAAGKVARANIALSEVRGRIERSGLTAAEVRAALELSDRDRFVTNERGERVRVPSPRERAVGRLKASHPELAERIDAVQAKYVSWQIERRSFDDPADLKRIMRGAGELTFRIAPQPGELASEAAAREQLRQSGPRGARSAEARWYRINDEEQWFDGLGSVEEIERARTDAPGWFAGRFRLVADEYDGELYVLLYDTPGLRLLPGEGVGGGVSGASLSRDEQGRDAIGFRMDPLGAERMRQLTSANLQRPMAILLDDQVYTAPNILGAISESGQIAGNFSRAEINYIVQVLNAGSLAAKLSPEPISETSVGPQLGADNLRRGLESGVVSFVLVAGFMVAYYFGGGLIAVAALVVNALMLLGVMALMGSAFSLPGIAGIVLTFGMAVDANVLIYERLREEVLRGSDLRTGVRLAYARAFSAIVDGNVTNLIACAVLYTTGTEEIKGFAITMSVGVMTTLFCQLYVTRAIYDLLIERVGLRKMSMLPTAVPALQRLLTPSIAWLSARRVFAAVSTLAVVGSVVMIWARWGDLFDTVFVGGTRVQVTFRNDPATGRPMTMTRSEVSELVRSVAQGPLLPLREAEVLPQDPQADQVTASRFSITTTISDLPAVSAALTRVFEGRLDQEPVLSFEGSGQAQARADLVRPVVTGVLGDNIDRPEVRQSVAEYVGGAAVVIGDIGPRPPTLRSLQERLRRIRNEPGFGDAGARRWEVVVVDGDPEAVRTAALLVRDEAVSYFDDQQRWAAELRETEWRLVREALTRERSLSEVESISPAVAAGFVAQAIVAMVLSAGLIVLYVWVRFSSLRFSLATIVPTLHDCVIAAGALAAAGYFYEASPALASSLGLLPFKVDLNVIAALLTILGYSLNDKIVIMDRIRENKGKLPYVSAEVVNRSVNQTFSRTLMTGGTTILASLVLYLDGGEAVRAFAFSFVVGIVVGTYSSVAIGAPLAWSRRGERGPTGARGPAAGQGASAGNGAVPSLPGAAVAS